jgi:C-terminal processing protease CtpA/Prc
MAFFTCMKKLLFFLLFPLTLSVQAQQLNKQQINDLYWLAKGWGYLKYHHPAVITGKHNWDSVLLASIDAIQRSNSGTAPLTKLINAAGAYEPAGTTYIPDSLFTFTDFSWIDRLPTPEQQQYFRNMKYVKRPDDQRYVTNISSYGKAGFAIFKADSALKATTAFNGKVGLLTLFRYWNAFNYFAPYKNLVRHNWDSVLLQLIPKFYSVKTQIDLLRLCEHLGSLTNDGHSYLSSEAIDSFYGLHTPPFTLKFTEGKYVVFKPRNDTLFAQTGLQPGDIILKKDGVAIEKIVAERVPYTVQPNEGFMYYRMGTDLLNTNKDSIKLVVLRDGKQLTKTIQALPYNKIPSQSGQVVWKKLDGNIAMVQLNRLRKDTLATFFNAISGTKALVIDARGYPRFDIWYEMLSYLQNKNQPFVYWQNTYLPLPGYFYYPASEADFYWVQPKANQYKGKIYLLVDESCGSLGEGFPQSIHYLAKARTVGSQTGGFNGNMTWVSVPGGAYLSFTGLGVLSRNVQQTQQSGIHINYEVKPTIKGITERRDEVLEAALKLATE